MMASSFIDLLTGDITSIFIWIGLWSSLYLFGEIVICSVLSRTAYRNQSPTQKTMDGILVQKNRYLGEWNRLRNTKSEYILWWNAFTRFASTLHAILMVYYSIAAYLQYGNGVFNFDYEVTNLRDATNIMSINIIMVGYLITDLIFLVMEQTEQNITTTVIHHAIGSASLYGFIAYKTLAFNSLYYNITEITTIPLNITWIMLHFELHKSVDYPILGMIFIMLGLVAWILYLIVRVCGGVILSYYLILNYDKVLALPPYCVVFAIFGNGIITVLNFIWFYKLTKMAFKQLVSTKPKHN